MTVFLDYDGTITSNYTFYVQLSSMLTRSGHVVIVLSGANYSREDEIKKELNNKGISYHKLITRPKNVSTGPKSIGAWKKAVLKSFNTAMWFDNEIKNYQDAGVNYSDLPVSLVKV